jgi:phage shock protein PspC (stress-responsive transcriptional regulator)
MAWSSLYHETIMPQLRDFRRSTNNKLIAGVCAGFAEWLDWKTNTVRILFVVGSFVPVIPGFVVYVILWVLVPVKHP